MRQFLSPFLEIGIADVIDIVIVTALVTAILTLVRRTHAGFVAIGILIVAALYVVARALNLQLTAWIFQGFFAVFLVIVVVVFQEELRQLFERIAVWSLRRREMPRGTVDPTDVVVKCLADFARQSVGALIVFPGTQPLQRYVQGGIELDGKVSYPLLASIFEKHSPGHDGAVIIENDRIVRFATHLPLSKEPQGLAVGGTRHSAALGLSERTDALCFVVSEERGEVSVARDGKLRMLGRPEEAAAILRAYLRQKHPEAEHGFVWGQLVRANRVETSVALGLVIALWYLFVPGSRSVEFTFEVPVAIHNLPPGYEVESIEPKTVRAKFVGPRRSFYIFDEERLEATIDGSLVKLGRRTFELRHEMLNYPKDLTLQELEPERVRVLSRKAGEPGASAQTPSAPPASEPQGPRQPKPPKPQNKPKRQ
jgi:uncharacterized protein (TIGR00159 family)